MFGQYSCVLLREKSLFDIVVIKPKTLTTVFPSARWKVYIEKTITRNISLCISYIHLVLTYNFTVVNFISIWFLHIILRLSILYPFGFYI